MSGKDTIWDALIGGRTPEFWVALLAGTIYVYRKSENQSRFTRMIEAGISGMLGYSIGPDVALWLKVNDALAVVLVSSFGYLMLDIIASVVADRAVLKSIINKRLGGGQ